MSTVVVVGASSVASVENALEVEKKNPTNDVTHDEAVGTDASKAQYVDWMTDYNHEKSTKAIHMLVGDGPIIDLLLAKDGEIKDLGMEVQVNFMNLAPIIEDFISG